MIKLFKYIRFLFCKHNLQFDEQYASEELKDDYGTLRQKKGTKVSVTCTKCGYHETYFNFLK